MAQSIESIKAGTGVGVDYEVLTKESQNIAGIQDRFTGKMKELDSEVTRVRNFYVARGSDAITAEVDAYWPNLVKMQETMGLYSEFLVRSGGMSMATDNENASRVNNTMVGL